MGVFGFLKDIGFNRFRDKDTTTATRPTKGIRATVEDMGMDVDNVRFSYKNGTVLCEGNCVNQEQKEKIVLIVGHMPGVTAVDDRMKVGGQLDDSFGPAGDDSNEAEAEAVSAPEPAQEDAEPEGFESRTYTVQSGDTLSGIAQKMYGKASKYMVIFEANQPLLSDPDKIRPGQVLRIPPLND